MNILQKVLGYDKPFLEMEKRNKQIKRLVKIIDEYDTPLEKLNTGVKHILGDDWYKSDEVETTQEQSAILSDLLIIVLYNSSNQSLIEEEE